MLNLHKGNPRRNTRMVALAVVTMLVGVAVIAPLLPNSTVLADDYRPGQVSNITNVTKVAAGHIHSLFLKSDGTVWAVGSNASGQLGDNTTTDRCTVVQVQVSGGGYLTNIVEIAAGVAHSVARKSDGTVWTWGLNYYGQLGDGTSGSTADKHYALQVSGVSSATGIAAGEYHTLALTGGTVKSWGRNNYGQLGNGTTSDSSSPVSVSSLSDAVQVAAGGFHSVARRSDNGKLKAWGRGGDSQLADSDNCTLDRSTPTTMYDNTGVTFTGAAWVTAGVNFTTVVTTSGKVWSTGQNGRGQQGTACNGTNCGFNKIGSFNNNSKVSAGCTGEHVAALNTGTTLKAWGRNEYGQVGDGSTTDRCSPVDVVDGFGSAISGFTEVSAGGLHTLAVKSDGTAWSWGLNVYCELGR